VCVRPSLWLIGGWPSVVAAPLNDREDLRKSGLLQVARSPNPTPRSALSRISPTPFPSRTFIRGRDHPVCRRTNNCDLTDDVIGCLGKRLLGIGEFGQHHGKVGRSTANRGSPNRETRGCRQPRSNRPDCGCDISPQPLVPRARRGRVDGSAKIMITALAPKATRRTSKYATAGSSREQQ
jgi:hypothetical protein